ncbi:cold-shock protein [Nitrospirillum viridazoti]|uniref:Cold-shock protein n=2 Tax=Nitrospirillum TaxID=1543705 RepID=A0A248JQV6_9PROT|nr:cold-shock protein [Nitrospirillum amazonense]ASG21087.1 cold-shock protein [Nitrospirillum amazonense CBAmc]TWB32407.1 putative cold-shock DNA-binding protein [Nitrospirillum amazonense]TWB48711.1 putative cold-shock DNA-binding protein [Nitrospirillum amazonense]
MYERRSPQSPQITRRGVNATVKWYNPTKGFGFVTLSDGSPDAFLHASVVQAFGHDSLADGTTINCDLSQGQKGPQVAAIHSVDESTATPGGGGGGMGGGMGGGRRDSFGGGAPRRAAGGWESSGPTETVEGTVKFYSADKGFGFVTPDGGGKDVFVHITALERSGVRALTPEQRVRLTTSMGQKGPQANRVEVL